MKTLEEAIGCWTTNPDYTGLQCLSGLVKTSALQCGRWTRKGNVPELQKELEVLRSRIGSLLDVTDDALRRLQKIVDTNELSNA